MIAASGFQAKPVKAMLRRYSATIQHPANKGMKA